MNKCKECGNQSLGHIVIFTETTFGHGDSGHETYVKCTNKLPDGTECGNKTSSYSGYGFFEDTDLRKAQAEWNKNNPGPY